MLRVDPTLLIELEDNLQTALSIVGGLALTKESGVSTTDLVRLAKIPHVRQSETITVLGILEGNGVVKSHGKRWTRLISIEQLHALEYALFGALTQKQRSVDAIRLERPEVVLTRPRAPSQLDETIANDTSLSVNIENTEDAFLSLAVSAEKSLTLMTPFLDESGAKWALSLFSAARQGVAKELILRFLGDPDSGLYPDGFPIIADELRQLQVDVYDFAIPRPSNPSFHETFHAKIIGADGTRAYVGSANLNRHSKETSMELGMLVTGTAARHVHRILEKVRGIAIVQ